MQRGERGDGGIGGLGDWRMGWGMGGGLGEMGVCGHMGDGRVSPAPSHLLGVGGWEGEGGNEM